MAILKSRKDLKSPWEVVGVGNPSPEEIDTHNTSPLAHEDIRNLINDRISKVPGIDGQVALSDGKGGIRFESVNIYGFYGIKVDKNNSNPKTRVTYFGDATGKKPAFMDFAKGEFNYGDWKDVWFIRNNKPVVLNADGTEAYELDPNDYTKKADGTPSDITGTETTTNVMSRIPLCYLYQHEDDRYEYYQISDRKLDERYIAIAHTKEDGSIADNVYISCYKGSEVGGKIRSLSGQWPIWEKNAQTELDYAKKNGNGWCTRTWGQRQLINNLLKLISKSTDSQAAFGNGNDSGYINDKSKHYGMLQSGSLNSMGQFFGYNTHNQDVKVFHIEGWWGNQWDRIAGLVLVDGNAKVSHKGPYNITGSGYTDIGKLALANGHIKNNKVHQLAALPLVTSGASSSTYECDYYYQNQSGTMYALVGGGCWSGSNCGSSYLTLRDTPSNSHWDFGAGLSFI